MNIALFTDTYLPDINGVASSTNILYQQLKKHGHHVLIVTTVLPSHSDYVDDGYVLRLPGVDIKKIYGYRAASIFSIKGMKEIKEFNPDVIHIQTEFGIGIFGRIAGEILNVPVCYTYHTMWTDYSHYIVPGSMKTIDYAAKKIIEKISKIYGDKCARLIVPSDKTAEALKSYGINREIDVIPTGIMLDKFEKRNERLVNEIISKYHLENKFVVTFLGRIASEKSIDILLYAFRKIKQVNKNIVLMIVGGGPQLDELKEIADDLEINDAVIFTGPKTSDEVPSYYHASSLFVSASTSETQGLTFVEAMACGVVPVAKYDYNLEDVIKNGQNGYFFNTEDELVSKVLELYDTDLTDVSKKAYQDAQKYSSENFYKNIISVYNKAINHHNYCYRVESITKENKHYMITFTCHNSEIYIKVSQNIFERYGLIVGDDVEREVLDALKDHEKSEIAYHQALKYLTYKDYTYALMKKKLENNGDFTDIQIEMAMDLLMKKKLIDDYEYTKAYFDKAKRLNIGINKVIDNLKKDGVSPFTIDECLTQYSNDIEYDKAISLIEKIYNENTSKSPNALINSIKNRLFNKGFSSNVIEKAIEDFSFEFEDEHTKMLLNKEYDRVYKRYSHKYEGNQLKNKVITFLLQKGYEYEGIVNMIEEKWEEEN